MLAFNYYIIYLVIIHIVAAFCCQNTASCYILCLTASDGSTAVLSTYSQSEMPYWAGIVLR